MSRQAEHFRETTLARLRAHVPDGCPLHVDRRVDAMLRHAFTVTGPGCECIGRAQVVAAFIDGYAAGWRERTGVDE